MDNTISQPQKLWNRDFSLLVFGQMVSIFGNMILSFALPLYILSISGSPTLFGLVLALPFVSLIITSPIGGLIADRFRKQRIMFWLDAATTVIIVLYMVFSGLFLEVVPLVIVKLMALNAIQGLYMPAVQSSVPVLVPMDKMVSANSVVAMINTTSSMAGTAIAGVLLARFGLFPILAVSAVCFAITAVMDLLIRIPYQPQESSGSMREIVKGDLRMAFRFIVKEKPTIAKGALLAFFLNVTIGPLLLVGIPVLVTQILGMGMDMVGLSQSVMMAGGVVGGILAGMLGARLSIQKAYLLLAIGGMTLLPMGLAFLFDLPNAVIYIVITLASALTMLVLQMSTILLISYIQLETPTELVGKVMSLLVILPFIANALGQLVYGVFFERFEDTPWLVIFATVLAGGAIALYARKHFGRGHSHGA